MNSNQLREKIRNNQFNEPTCGYAKGFIQTNLVIIETEYADDFNNFCDNNPKPCPIVERLEGGSFNPNTAKNSDLRTDIVLYRKFVNGDFDCELNNLTDELSSEFTAFLLGCSFSFENALTGSGIYLPHFEKKGNVAMYSTSLNTKPSKYFSGPLVVSMRWIPEDKVDQAVKITEKYIKNHGGPIHIGDPSKIGINSIESPDFGDYWSPLNKNDVPVFWACGVTPQLSLQKSKLPLVYTHSPGYMFVTDLKENEYS